MLYKNRLRFLKERHKLSDKIISNVDLFRRIFPDGVTGYPKSNAANLVYRNMSNREPPPRTCEDEEIEEYVIPEQQELPICEYFGIGVATWRRQPGETFMSEAIEDMRRAETLHPQHHPGGPPPGHWQASALNELIGLGARAAPIAAAMAPSARDGVQVMLVNGPPAPVPNPPPTFDHGEKVVLGFDAPIPGDLVALYVDAWDDMMLLAPSAFMPNNTVRAGTVTLPMEQPIKGQSEKVFWVSGPPGLHQVVFIVAPGLNRLDLPRHRPDHPAPYIGSAELRELSFHLAHLPARSYAMGVVPFQVRIASGDDRATL